MQQVHTLPEEDSPLIAEHLANNTLELGKSEQQPGTGTTGAAQGDNSPALGGGGMHPAVTRHLRNETPGMGGGGMHPAVAKHLQE